MRFICSDESVNSYGFWVLTQGIGLERFLKNPVMLWNHSRSYGSKNDVLPIGYWKDVKIENGCLTAEPVFDTKDEFAQQIASKVKQGVVRSCSIGIRILATSTEEGFLKPGQTRETITGCELREISICDIPANGNAVTVALYDEQDNLLSLAETGDSIMPLLIQNKRKMKEVLKELGLADNATETLAVDAVRKLNARVSQLEKEKQDAEEAALKGVVDEAIKARKLTEAKRNTFMEIGRKNGIAALREVLAEMAAPVKPSDFINPKSQTGKEATFGELSAKEKETLRSEDPERYAALFEAEYGFKPDFD